MRVAVFCSANSNLDPDFYVMTEEVGRFLAREGHTLVFGGTSLGLMETVALAFKAEQSADSGLLVGVVPTKVEDNHCVSKYLDVHIPCNDLTDRKALMMEQSDIFLALPGGIGTLDEIFSVAAMATIGYHNKPVVLYNMKGFWDSFVLMLNDLHARGVTRKQWDNYIKVVSSLDELKALLNG